MGYLRKVREELLDPSSPLLGSFSQADLWDRNWAGHGQAALERLLEPWEPNWPIPSPARSAVENVALIGVYRSRNAPLLHRLVGEVPAGNTALWALDEVAPALKSPTLGAGPGTRFGLLNRLVERLSLGAESWLVIADDDVRFVRHDLRCAVSLARFAGLDLCQPSHSRWSYLNWEVGRHRPGRSVRLCRFVEQGPLIILSPKGRQALLPLPDDIGMGWGLEAVWAANDDLRTGIIDAVTIMHERPVGQGGYDTRAQWEQAERLRMEEGWESWNEVQRVHATWWAWQQTPPWMV